MGKIDEMTDRPGDLFECVKELRKVYPEPRRSEVEETERCMSQN
jgi:hypothetical protein